MRALRKQRKTWAEIASELRCSVGVARLRAAEASPEPEERMTSRNIRIITAVAVLVVAGGAALAWRYLAADDDSYVPATEFSCHRLTGHRECSTYSGDCDPNGSSQGCFKQRTAHCAYVVASVN